MFSKTTRWEARNELTQINFAAPGERSIPKKALIDKHGSTLISMYRYRIIYEPCIPDDNFFCLDIRLGAPSDFLFLPDECHFLEKTDTSCILIFTINKDFKIFTKCLDNLEDFLLRTTPHEYKKNLNSECNKLRDFVNFAPRIIDSSSSVDNMSDEKQSLTCREGYSGIPFWKSTQDIDNISDKEKKDISSGLVSSNKREEVSDDSISDEEMADSVFGLRYRIRQGL